MLRGSIKNIGDIEDMKESKTKIAIVTGAGGFIGSHLVKRLKGEGYWVRGVDLKYPEFSETEADEFIICDLRYQQEIDNTKAFESPFESDIIEMYALAAWMGGAGMIFTGDNDAEITYSNALINCNTAHNAVRHKATKLFYASSACCYNQYNQLDPDNPKCSEDSAYPADPDSPYGFEKLFSEKMYDSFSRNHGLNIRIARFHNIFGPEGTWDGGREKAPAALCRKIIKTYGGIEMWGDGKQTRSFLYIDECVEGVRRLMESDFKEPVNIGSEEMISIKDFALMISTIENKDIVINHIEGPIGVAGRNSDNTLIQEKLGWSPSQPLIEGITETYYWIKEQISLNS